VVPDGTGGWFIGGDFSGVGGLPRANLAHIQSNGKAAAWAPTTDAPVLTLAYSGTTLYVGASSTW
jgi:hypothetical protein